MNNDASIDVWDLLLGFGFQPDPRRIPDLSFDFGNFNLSATWGMSLCNWFQEVVLFGGIMETPHTLAMVEFEMPLRVISREQGAAWIVWHLDESSRGKFTPTNAAPWLEMGRQHQETLPWEQARLARERERAAYNARPRCDIERKWARLGLNTLAELLATVEDDEPIVFGFDGTVLKIQCAEKVVAMSGVGAPWPNRYSITARKLRQLPKRLLSNAVDVSVYGSTLLIDRSRYSGVEQWDLRMTENREG